MFLNNKPNTRLGAASKARLNIHSHPHKLDIERKKSPDGLNSSPAPPCQPTECLVFNNTTSRAAHYNRSLPEVPNIEEIEKFMKDSWDERIRRINDPSLNLKVLWIKSQAEEDRERLAAEAAAAKQQRQNHQLSSSNSNSSSTQSSLSGTPKQKNSPLHAPLTQTKK